MSSAVTTTVNVISMFLYAMERPTGSVIDANPTATTIGLECPSHPKMDCDQAYTNTFVVGPWASTVVPEGLPSTGTFQWLFEVEREAISYECLMSSGIRQTCTGLQIPLGYTTWEKDHHWTRHSWTVTDTEDMVDLTQIPVVITSGQEHLGSDFLATATETSSKPSSGTISPVTQILFIRKADEYDMATLTGSVISANPTATTIDLGCPVKSDCPYKYSNTFVVGPWASTVVPEGSASTGTFYWYLSNSDTGDVISVKCLMSSGMPQTCTSSFVPLETMPSDIQEGFEYTATATATNMGAGFSLETHFTRVPIVITAGQELLGLGTEATATSTDTASPEETNGAGSSAACVLGVVAIAVIASLIIN
ncbi:uncharacterized protein BKA55DRAFT_593278 [Fusarium redolens]|uniref:Uncharacterized protein n=1 Tax=Fusarium redolens TaxID=48865 RepID=A0A9P9H9N2_FUSRE|nr:uncharacterized protein BKA55DRAFT_593278 [Fusarium redolens]KAH7253585.1 hypothetical protein BKA55DRAFT_593278 [Fusarium redolens]